ncbi:MAG: hypothetical protein ACRC7P_04380, partial [Enterovibrio sp.]
AHSAQPEPEVDLSCSPEQERQNCIRAALQLGDIERVGETEPAESHDSCLSTPIVRCLQGALQVFCCSLPPLLEGYPIYQFNGSENHDELKFTADPSYRCSDSLSDVPHYIHHSGQVHSSMEQALWAGFCYDHPTESNLENYQALCRGIKQRYLGLNTPQ